MSETKRYLIYFKPPDKVSDWIRSKNREISKKYNNRYMKNKKYEWTSHLMVYLGQIPMDKEKELVDLTKNLVKNIKIFKIKLANLEIAEGGFIFVGINPGSYPILNKISKSLVLKIKKIGGSNLKYKYKPHLSIASVPNDKIISVMNFIGQLPINGITFSLKFLFIARENLDPEKDWSIISKISLRN